MREHQHCSNFVDNKSGFSLCKQNLAIIIVIILDKVYSETQNTQPSGKVPIEGRAVTLEIANSPQTDTYVRI